MPQAIRYARDESVAHTGAFLRRGGSTLRTSKCPGGVTRRRWPNGDFRSTLLWVAGVSPPSLSPLVVSRATTAVSYCNLYRDHLAVPCKRLARTGAELEKGSIQLEAKQTAEGGGGADRARESQEGQSH